MEIKKEGFFRQDKEELSDLPWPEVSESPDLAFIEKLKQVEKRAEKRRYRGMSRCRVCGIMNGSSTFFYKEWQWPDGYMHYLKDHNQKPTQEFRMFIESEWVDY